MFKIPSMFGISSIGDIASVRELTGSCRFVCGVLSASRRAAPCSDAAMQGRAIHAVRCDCTMLNSTLIGNMWVEREWCFIDRCIDIAVATTTASASVALGGCCTTQQQHVCQQVCTATSLRVKGLAMF
jgi:hypothetical protein